MGVREGQVTSSFDKSGSSFLKDRWPGGRSGERSDILNEKRSEGGNLFITALTSQNLKGLRILGHIRSNRIWRGSLARRASFWGHARPRVRGGNAAFNQARASD